MTDFLVDQVGFGDPTGLGQYEIGHYRQHVNYTIKLATRGIYVSDYPIMHMVGDNKQELASWLAVHENLHAILRGYAHVTGFDLSFLNTESAEAWYNWQAIHAIEHTYFDQIFGVP